MATYPIAFPPQAPTSEILRVAFQQAAMESPHTFAQQTVSKADHWLLEFQWPRMSHGEAERIAAWLDSLRGQLGSFTYTPRSAYRTNVVGVTIAQIAYGYSNTVSLAGWTAQGASGLSLGQYCQIGERLHRITSAPVNADANGRCLVEVVPQIRRTQAVGTAVEFQNPKGMFRLTSAESYAFTLDPDRQPSFPTIVAKEAF